MLKVMITPKKQIPGGGFFLDHDNTRTYKTNAVAMSNGHLLLWDNLTDSCFNHPMDFASNFYDITQA